MLARPVAAAGIGGGRTQKGAASAAFKGVGASSDAAGSAPASCAPRGFGFGSADLDDVQEIVRDTKVSSDVRAYRDRILSRWAEVVRSAGKPPSKPIAALRNVSLAFGDELVLRGVTWEVCKSQILGVVGESGSGKSSQLRLLASGRAAEAPSTGALTGEVWLDPDQSDPQYIPQDVLAALSQETRSVDEYVRCSLGAEDIEDVWAWLGWTNAQEDQSDDEVISETGSMENEVHNLPDNERNEWDAAPEKERRKAPDGQSYTKEEFVSFFGGDIEWNAAQPEQKPNKANSLRDSEHEADSRPDSEISLAGAFGSQTAVVRAAAVGRSFFGPGALGRAVSELSSGQQVRLALAIALARRPSLLLCDEPTNHLDVDGILWLEGALQAAVRASLVGAAVVVSHDRAFLEHVCTHTLDATGGSGMLYSGSYNSFVIAKQRRLESLASMDSASEVLAREPFRSPNKAPSRFRLVCSKAQAADADLPLLSLAGAAVLPRGSASTTDPLLPAVDLQLRRGECVLVLGPNGAGKSSLLRAAAGAAGAIVRGERTLSRDAKVFHFRQEAADALALMGSASAADVLRRSSGGEAAGVSDERMYRVMKQLGLPVAVQHTAVEHLSGGERARLCLAQMLLSGATVLICDEPTNHLDVEARAYLLEALRYFDGAVLLTSHDRHFAAAASTRFVEILDGDVHSAATGQKLPFATKYGLAQEASVTGVKPNRGKRQKSKRGRLLSTPGILGDCTAADASTAADGWDALICEPPKASKASGGVVSPRRMRSNLLARARVVPGTKNKKQGKAFWTVYEESKLHPRWRSRQK